jgi:hypothetical protein
MENFWGTLKRGTLGIYHHVSAKHLQKYVDEFAFRYNNNHAIKNLIQISLRDDVNMQNTIKI